MKSYCYLSDDFSTSIIPEGVIISPEALLNGEQIKSWVAELHQHPKNFATTSLYLLRELELQKCKVEFINITNDYIIRNEDVSSIGNIEILDRELEQSDRYLEANHNANQSR